MSTELMWFKSSYSSTGGGECLEVALCARSVHVRDSKFGERSPRFEVPAAAWAEFLAYAAREA
ncbi:DUF397 domain-containing protein [Streptomyces thermogriseus]|jgi:hypothetical protein|uniref:DUF397 domain-containing protein n=1 Tax=Streptomyces thermogriseus TaxID=75292 RepID=A0ABN1T435_9ACTN